MLKAKRTPRTGQGLRPGLSKARTLPASRVDEWLAGPPAFDPTKYGISFQFLSWTEDPQWLPPANLGLVTSVRDASGNGLDAIQGTTANCPAYMIGDGHLGGRPSIRGGYDTFLRTPAFAGALSQPVSFVFIGYMHTPYWDTASSAAVALDHGTTAGNATLYSITQATHAGKIGYQTGALIEGSRDMRAGVWVAKGGASGFASRNGVVTLSGNLGTNTVNRLSIGNLPAAATFQKYANWGGWSLVAVYNGDITTEANWGAFCADAQRYYALNQNPALFAIDGDSRCTNYPHGTAGPTPAEQWPALIANTTTTPLVVPNFGVPGQTQAAMNADAVAQVDAIYNATNAKNIAYCGGGINDLPADSAATIETAIQTWCTTRRAAGYQVIVATIPPASSVSGANETKRAAINTWIRANWSSWADQLCDLDNDSRLQTPSNTTYYLADGVHYTAAGHAVVAELVKANLAALGLTIAAAPASTFTPLTLSPQVWLDAADSSSITASGGLVTGWADKSGNANHMTAAGSARPTTGATTQNSLNVLDFNGTSTVLESAASVPYATQTWYVAAKATDASAAMSPVFIGPRTASGLTMGVYIDATGTGPWYLFQNGTGSVNHSLARSTSDVMIWLAEFTGGANGVNQLLLNGVDNVLAPTLPAATPAVGDRLTVGSLSRTSTPFYFKGSVFEVLIYSGLHTSNQVANVLAYLRTKWGTT